MSSENRFVDNGNGTVTDLEKGLMWNHTDSMNDLAKWMNYQDSADYARELNEKRFAGYDNWRLPTYDEWQVLNRQFSIVPRSIKFSTDPSSTTMHSQMVMDTVAENNRQPRRDDEQMVVKEWLTEMSDLSLSGRIVEWSADNNVLTKRYPWEGFYDVGFRTVMDVSDDAT